MSSFRHLLADHAPVLLLDACSARVQIGWLVDATNMRWAASDAEAGIGVFNGIKELGISPQDAGALVYCDGPGSILGIRTVAMALRIWNVLAPKPTFSYHGLQLLAHSLGRPELTIIADARRDTWHSFKLGSALRRVPTAELAGELATPEGFRHWSTLPPSATQVPYSLAAIVPRILDLNLLKATDAPDAFLHEEPSYVTWTPQIHRAP